MYLGDLIWKESGTSRSLGDENKRSPWLCQPRILQVLGWSSSESWRWAFESWSLCHISWFSGDQKSRKLFLLCILLNYGGFIYDIYVFHPHFYLTRNSRCALWMLVGYGKSLLLGLDQSRATEEASRVLDFARQAPSPWPNLDPMSYFKPPQFK